jgi:hypothetical protein
MFVRIRRPVALSVVLSPSPPYALASRVGGSESPASDDVVATALPKVDGVGAASPPPGSVEAVPDDDADDVPVAVERPELAENA